MKYREILINQLKTLPYFGKESFRALGQQYALKVSALNSYISISLKNHDLIQLKKGMYVTADFYEKNIGDVSYKFYLANVLRSPSYVSSWTALQYYDLTTEAIRTVISVTSKVTRTNNNRLGSFEYHNIKKKYYSGFTLVKGKQDFYIATPAKALFDLLYFRYNQLRGVKLEDVEKIVAELRIDLDEMEKKEQDEFFNLVKNHLNKYG